MKKYDLMAVVGMMAAVTCFADSHLYVDGINGNDANDGSSWNKAFKTVNKAFSVWRPAPRFIHFATGTYHLTSVCTSGDAQQWNLIGGSEDPADTVIDGGGDYRAFWHYLKGGNGGIGQIRNITFRNCRSKLGPTAFYYDGETKMRPLSYFGFAGGAFSMAPPYVVWKSTTTSGSATGPTDADCLVSNCVFEACGNEVFAQGHAIALPGGARVIDCVFKNNGSACVRAVSAVAAASTDMKNTDWNVEGPEPPTGTGTVGGGGQGGTGGAVYIFPGVNMTNYFVNCHFEGNYTKAGASCIVATPSVWTGANNTDLLSMWTNNWGIVLEGCTFVSNRTDALVNGIGGVVRGRILRAENCTFRENHSGGYYGAVLTGGEDDDTYYTAYRTLLPATNWIVNCTFISNRSDGVSAGYNPGGYAKSIVSNCTFFANEASNAVAICTRRSSMALKHTSTLQENRKTVSCLELVLVNCRFEQNKATSGPAWSEGEDGKSRYQDGIALASKYTKVTVESCQFIGNEALSGASAIAVGENSKIVNCTFCGNKIRGGFGGCIMMQGSSVSVLGCLFDGNRNTFTNSVCFAGDYDYIDSIVVKTADPWGVRDSQNGARQTTVANCTFVDNPSGVFWGPYAATSGKRGYNNIVNERSVFKNCIFWQSPVNRRLISNNSKVDEPAATCCIPSYSYLENDVSAMGTANIFGADPGFREDLDGMWRLKRRSPCRNAGLVDSWMSDYPTDIDGTVRVLPSGKVDLGCFAFVPYSVGFMLLVR